MQDLSIHCDLSEGPLWHPVEEVLYWVDITAKKLYRYNPRDKQYADWQMPDVIGCIGLRKNGGFIAGIGDEICFIDIPSGKVTAQKKVPGGLRLNDGKIDGAGRFWIGTADPIHGKACLYRYEADGHLQVMEENLFISNGLGWNAANSIFYLNDSVGKKTYAYDFNAGAGIISERQTLIDFSGLAEEPDGLTVDAEDNIWIAFWNGGRLTRFDPEGNIIREIKMPVQRPTSCIFGGEDYKQLFVTSCARDVAETTRLADPAGSIFVLHVGVSGLPEREFLV